VPTFVNQYTKYYKYVTVRSIICNVGKRNIINKLERYIKVSLFYIFVALTCTWNLQMTTEQSFCFCKFRPLTAEWSYQSAVTYNRIMRDHRKKYNVVFLESSKQFGTHNNAKNRWLLLLFDS
jgi:hypothetical protein